MEPRTYSELELAENEVNSLRARVAELEAARIAYAREFPLNEEGEPDVGSIHQNIRALKAERDRLLELLAEWMLAHEGIYMVRSGVVRLTRAALEGD